MILESFSLAQFHCPTLTFAGAAKRTSKRSPPLFKTVEDRAGACYLYKDTAQVEGKVMARSLTL
jgi:hypothetical protein